MSCNINTQPLRPKGWIQVLYAKMVAPEGLGVNWHNGNDPPCKAPSLVLNCFMLDDIPRKIGC